MIENEFIVVSFYTRATSYKDDALRLAASLHHHGLEWKMEAIDSLGSWQANTYYKAEFLRKMLDEYPDKDLVWLDVDVTLHSYPGLFETIDADLGVHFIDWKKYGKSDHRELNTSVMFVKNNQRMRQLIDEWISENKQMINTGIWEQMNLQNVLADQRDLKIVNLPATYCKIFDFMKEVKNPVIELMQASRRYRAEVDLHG
jgi:hypothetical protein